MRLKAVVLGPPGVFHKCYFDQLDDRKFSNFQSRNYSLANSVRTFFNKAEMLRAYVCFRMKDSMIPVHSVRLIIQSLRESSSASGEETLRLCII